MIAGAPVAAHDARDLLLAALAAAREYDLRDDEPRVLDAALAHLRALRVDDSAGAAAPGARLAAELTRFAAARSGARQPLADLLGLAARELAPDGAPPAWGAGAEAWRAALAAVEGLYGGGFRRLGRLAFVDAPRLQALAEEARSQPRAEIDRGHALAEPGPALRALAVDPRLRALVADAVGFAVRPSYRAVYMHLRTGTRVPPHVDHPDYEVIVHLTLEHAPPADGSPRAGLVVFRCDRPPARVVLAPGEAMVLRGRGSIHARDALKAGEEWSSTAIGFAPATA